MSKQSKKQKKRRERQKRNRQRNLITLFRELYPNAPNTMALAVTEYYLVSAARFTEPHRSKTAMLKQVTLAYVKETMTAYNSTLDQYLNTVLDSLEAGAIYVAQTPHSIEVTYNAEAKAIINTWRG